MSPRSNLSARRPGATRRGLSLVELLLSISIMSIMAGVLSALALAVRQSSEYSQGYGNATQHARVSFERIARAVSGAMATETYPGVAVVSEQVGAWRFPDMLVIWRPSGAPANAAGPPLMRELVIFCPDPNAPHQLIEVTAPKDSRPVPLNETLDTVAWRSELNAVARAATSRRTTLTHLLRAAPTGDAARDTGDLRGAVRFELELRPTATEMSDFRAGTKAWSALSWPQGSFSSRAGLRLVWLRTELQLLPDGLSGQLDPLGERTIPFLGSATLCYGVRP